MKTHFPVCRRTAKLIQCHEDLVCLMFLRAIDYDYNPYNISVLVKHKYSEVLSS